MDFLILMLGYILIFIISLVCYFYGHTPLLSTGPIGALNHLIAENVLHYPSGWLVYIGIQHPHNSQSHMQTVSWSLRFVIPKTLRDSVYNGLNTALHTRNHLLQFVFGTLVVLGHGVWVIDMLPVLYMYHPDTNHTLIPLVVVFSNLVFYHLSCNSDPGEITPATFKKYQKIYPFDGRLFLPGIYCKTCDLLKPARSKHCSICDRCVHRFDHHCIWTNNDVGGLNHRYFLMFLITLVVIAIEGITVGAYSLWLYADHRKLMQARVLLKDGSTEAVTVFVAFQHLFMTFPRLVFLVIALTLLLPLIGAFTSYHTFLVMTNQTTNERYKTPEIEKPSNKSTHSVPGEFMSLSRQRKNRNTEKQTEIPKRPYDKGVLYNISDIFFLKTIKKKKR